MQQPVVRAVALVVALAALGCRVSPEEAHRNRSGEHARPRDGPSDEPEQTIATGQLADVFVRVKKAGLVRPAGLERPCLALAIDILNTSETRKIDYTTRAATLGDELGNAYRRMSAVRVGTPGSGSIYPGASVREVLVFEEPVARARLLLLTLPGEGVGLEGELVVEVQSSAVAD